MYTSNQIFTLGVFAGILLITAGILVVVIYDRIRANRFNAHTNQMLHLVGEYGPTPLNEDLVHDLFHADQKNELLQAVADDLTHDLHLAEREIEQLQAEIADLKDGVSEGVAAFNELLADNEDLEATVKHYKVKLLNYASDDR